VAMVQNDLVVRDRSMDRQRDADRPRS
jgi:hypothetical protein